MTLDQQLEESLQVLKLEGQFLRANAAVADRLVPKSRFVCDEATRLQFEVGRLELKRIRRCVGPREIKSALRRARTLNAIDRKSVV